ncbi:hypothetical protein PCAU_5529 [Pseudomonas chlororaphis subsp. aurantiaca]|uniref:SH3 domain-containing protein n=1 Tax=Pseudomonas chlororaphis TaxID=587753 RepID=UPI0008657AB7|nr:SH3 domain-containing protein [Pseudomonas chlororaphis]BAV77738.1 hypothetical protein PCAU_5529 [Pseudomonas chlororaphis subsp. aurantiaca]
MDDRDIRSLVNRLAMPAFSKELNEKLSWLKRFSDSSTVLGQTIKKIDEERRRFDSLYGVSRVSLLKIGEAARMLKIGDSVALGAAGRAIRDLQLNPIINHNVVKTYNSYFKSISGINKKHLHSFDVVGAWVLEDIAADSSGFVELLSSEEVVSDQLSSELSRVLEREDLSERISELQPEETHSAMQEVFALLLGRSDLKNAAPKQIIWLVIFFLTVLPMLSFINESFELQKNLAEAFRGESPAEVRSLIRRPPIEFDRAKLSGMRISTASLLILRQGPSKKSDEIQGLPLGTPLTVLDDDSRSWIFVSALVDGEAYQGWVLRRYTKRIR